jgi:glycosyltransferase involved in cell wall biosynthesis
MRNEISFKDDNGRRRRMRKTVQNRTLAVIPCRDEEATVANVILKAKRFVNEVLVIDDGSRDETRKIAQEAGAVVISHKTNRGKGAAIRTGFQYALKNDFEYIVTIDGDGQHDPLEIPELLENVIHNGHDISVGFRAGTNTEMPMWRRVGKRVLDYTTSIGTGGFVTDSQCGFRAFNRTAVERITPQLKGDAFSIESEQLIKAHEFGLKMANTNVTCKYRNLQTSTKNPASHGLSVLGYILWVVAERRPLLFISVPGFISVVFGLVLAIYTLQFTHNTVFFLSYLLAVSVLVIVGAVAVLVGLLLHVFPKILGQLRE